MRHYLLVFFFLLSASISAQDKTPQKLKVFIDCSNAFCDLQFIRTEINVVDFLLDRVAADVHVLITQQRNGSGGRQYQMIYYGQNSFLHTRDTLRFITDPNATDFELRDKMLKYLKLGLAPLVAKTNQADGISITMKRDVSTDSARDFNQTKDEWNYWVFRVGGNGHINMDQVYKNSELRGNFRFNRTTDDWKISFGFFGGLEKSSYEYETDSGPLEVVVKNTNYSFEHTLVKSINTHWSYGYQVSFLNNTFSNYKSRVYILPQVEYSFFPYKDVNNRFVTIRYGIGAQSNIYYDTTIYNKTEEMLLGHNAELNISFNQKWGVINTGISYRNYFHDWKVNNLGLATQMEVRVTGGLSFYIYLFGGLVHDQIYLPGEGASGEEVLSRQRQLESSYNFETFFGINYRFGTKLNNFINPRFNSTFDDF
ncbi:MAG: hypothetical protein AABY93_03355 [Bacteroidota bacterium]